MILLTDYLSSEGRTGKRLYNLQKKIIVISTFKLAPIARVVRESENSRLFSEWMEVEDAVLIMKEETSRDENHRFNIYIQHENCPHID